jgi:hypothetical protein
MRIISLLFATLLLLTRADAFVVTAGVGQFQIPTAPAAGVSVVSAAANTYTATAIQLSASTSAIYITGVHVESSAALAATYISCQLMIGAGGSETAIGQFLVPLSTGSTVALGFHPINPPIPVANGTRLSVKMADSVGSKTYLVSVECILQSNTVDSGKNISGNVTQWSGTNVAAPATAGIPEVNVKNIDNDAASASGTVTFPNATLASTTNITAGTITTATTCTTCSALTTNNDKTGYTLSSSGVSAIWQDTTAGDFTTALSIGKSIMNGVSLGTGLTVNALTTNNDKTGYSLSVAPPTSSAIATAVWQDATAGDFTTTSSIGKSLYTSGVVPGGAGGHFIAGTNAATTVTTALTTTFTGNLTGSVGSVTGLTASNLDTTVSSRMATYTQPTGFLAATFPTGTIANTTNITAGTITTASNLTTNNDKTGYTLTVTPPTAATIATTLWQDLTSGSDFTTSGSIGKLFVDDINATISSRMATYTQPTGFLAATFPSGTVANTTNITAGTITTATNLTNNNDKTGYSLVANQHVIVDSGTVTTLTNLPSIPANWLTAAGIDSGALNGKGDWLLSSSYTAPPSAATIATTTWQDLTASSDFTTVGSVGKLIVDDLNATISSRSTYAGADTSGTTTLLTRIPSALTITTGKVDVNDKTGYSLVAGYDPAKTAAQAGDAMTLTAAYDAAKTAATQASVNAIPTNPLTTLGANAPSGWINAAAIASSALNGKGDWNIGKTGYSLTSAYDPAKVDPLNVTLPGSYTGQKAGYLIWKTSNKP